MTTLRFKKKHWPILTFTSVWLHGDSRSNTGQFWYCLPYEYMEIQEAILANFNTVFSVTTWRIKKQHFQSGRFQYCLQYEYMKIQDATLASIKVSVWLSMDLHKTTTIRRWTYDLKIRMKIDCSHSMQEIDF